MSHPARKPTLWTRAYPDRHFSHHVDFPFLESLLYTSIPLIRNVLATISMRGLRRLIWFDTLRRDVGFLAGRLTVCSN